jgi:hypothetical protein
MSSNPYENEPGFETANDEGDKKNQKDYVAKVDGHFCFSIGDLTDRDLLDPPRNTPNFRHPATRRIPRHIAVGCGPTTGYLHG